MSSRDRWPKLNRPTGQCIHTPIKPASLIPSDYERILYGDVAWNKRGLAHRAQTSAGGYASGALAPEALAGLLGVDGVMVSRERYQSGASAKSKVVSDVVLLFRGEEGLTSDDPSNTKRFWTPVDSGVALLRPQRNPRQDC